MFDRYEFGRHIITLNTDYIDDMTDLIDIISFSEEEIKELREIDPRLEIESSNNGEEWLVARGEQMFLNYYSFGDYCFGAFIENFERRDDNELHHFPSAFFIIDDFDALKEKVAEYALFPIYTTSTRYTNYKLMIDFIENNP